MENEFIEIDIENSCRICLKAGVPLKCIFDVAINDITYSLLIVRNFCFEEIKCNLF